MMLVGKHLVTAAGKITANAKDHIVFNPVSGVKRMDVVIAKRMLRKTTIRGENAVITLSRAAAANVGLI